jgi:hypothetical protein
MDFYTSFFNPFFGVRLVFDLHSPLSLNGSSSIKGHDGALANCRKKSVSGKELGSLVGGKSTIDVQQFRLTTQLSIATERALERNNDCSYPMLAPWPCW